MTTKIYAYLLVIILIAFFLRFYKVTEIPPALNWDEVSIGYNAYSVLKTGHDEWGEFLPVHFKSYGEYKLPAQIYASIPAILVFGLNDFGVRITPIIYGTLTVLLMFFLTKAIFNNNLIAILASFLLAISPWHIHLTRASFESSFAVFWIVLATALLIKGFSQSRWLILSAVTFAISVYTYNSARVFTPLFLLAVFLTNYKLLFLKKKNVLIAIAIFITLMIPVVQFVFSGAGSARYKLVSITDDPGLVLRINETRRNSNLPIPFPHLLYNKVTFTSFYFIRNYISHFTPDFLFLSGAPHKQHHVQGMGELYLFQAPFLYLGFLLMFQKKERYRWLIIIWLLLSNVPVSVTRDSIPHALRTLIAVPTYQLVTAYGGYYFYLWLKDRSFLLKNGTYLISLVIFVFSIGYYLHNYYNAYLIAYSKDWQYGYKQAVDFISKQSDNYDLIVFTRHYGEPHMFTLFYLNYDPAKFRHDPNLIRFETYDWIRVLRFNKFYFPDLGDSGTRYEDVVRENQGKKMLFIGKNGDFPRQLPRLLTIKFLNGKTAFDIVESK